jgi:GT2 family glycosyltransferase
VAGSGVEEPWEADVGGSSVVEPYEEDYYQRMGFSRENPFWSSHFGRIADAIVEHLNPRTVLDAGCAIGYLVEELRRRGVDARGFDASPSAIGMVPDELKPYFHVQSLDEEIQGNFDLITCIEIVEHLPPAQARDAIANLCRHADTVLFSSTPDDFDEPTHINVNDGGYWASLFADQGFCRVFEDEVSSLVAPQTVIFCRGGMELSDAIRGYETLLTQRMIRERDAAVEAKRQSDELLKELDRTVVEFGLATLSNRELRAHQRWNEEHRRTRLFRYTLRSRELYKWFRQRLSSSYLKEEVSDADGEYRRWVDDFEAIIFRSTNLKLRQLERMPMISVVMPVFDVDTEYLKSAARSVVEQAYPNWELCIADDCSTNEGTRAALREIETWDNRIKVIYRDRNGHISAASNSALELATGEWVALLDHDDLLAPHALAALAVSIVKNPDAVLIYSDRDMVDDSGRRFHPYFKPDFDPELILSLNYLCHLTVIRKDLVDRLGGFRLGVEGSQDWDLSLRVIAQSRAEQIVHLPLILYHWRFHPGSVSMSLEVKPYAAEAAKKAIGDCLASLGRPAVLEPLKGGGWYHVKWEAPEVPVKVAVIVDGLKAKRLTAQLEAIKRVTSAECSLLVLLGGSSVVSQGSLGFEQLEVAEDSSFAARMNQAIGRLDADFVCLLDARLVPEGDGWIEELLQNARQPGIGVVGPRILQGEKFLHTGIILGLDDGVGELYRGAPISASGAYGRLVVAREFSAVNRACMMIDKRSWESVGGFNEEDTPIHFPEVDFSLRLREAGLRTLWTPFASLFDLDGSLWSEAVGEVEDPLGRQEELSYLKRRWADVFLNDPHFNPNLRLDSGNDGFSPATPPRIFELDPGESSDLI